MTHPTIVNSNDSRPADYDHGRLLAMQVMLCSRMDELFQELGVSLVRTSRMYVGACPVHGGDNVGALNIYRGGDSVPGYWRCMSRHCESTFKKTVIGFVRGVLSRREYGWSGATSERTVSFHQTVEWCCKFLGVKFQDMKIDVAELEKRQYISQIASVVRGIEQEGTGIPRHQAFSKLNFPGKYFIDRGWSPKVLSHYDVGTPLNDASPMRGRTVVPIYDNTGSYLIGATARSLYERCSMCEMWHKPGTECPSRERWADFSKWKNSPGFRRETTLYNYWNAKSHIKRSSTVILVEGPGDLWRLVESGIHIGVAMLGTSLSDQQQVILEMSGAMTVVVCTNTDAAGVSAADKLRKQLCRSFRIVVPSLPANDLGDISPAQLRETLIPVLDKVCQ